MIPSRLVSEGNGNAVRSLSAGLVHGDPRGVSWNLSLGASEVPDFGYDSNLSTRGGLGWSRSHVTSQGFESDGRQRAKWVKFLWERKEKNCERDRERGEKSGDLGSRWAFSNFGWPGARNAPLKWRERDTMSPSNSF